MERNTTSPLLKHSRRASARDHPRSVPSVGGVMPLNCLLPKRGLSSTAGRQWERIIASAAATGRAPQRFFMSENANDLEKENSRCECSWNW